MFSSYLLNLFDHELLMPFYLFRHSFISLHNAFQFPLCSFLFYVLQHFLNLLLICKNTIDLDGNFVSGTLGKFYSLVF